MAALVERSDPLVPVLSSGMEGSFVNSKAAKDRRSPRAFGGHFKYTSRGFAPSPGPTTPRASKMSTIRAARV